MIKLTEVLFLLFTQDATYYAQQIRAGIVSSELLVQRSLENIETFNPILNAVTIVEKERAIKRALEMDQAFEAMAKEDQLALPPFYGVPILLKDLGQNQAGVLSTSGARLTQNDVPSQTDLFVSKIEAAGFVVVGRTNTPEFGFKNISDSELHGVVSSPLDLKRNPGGSSGGAAAALKAGLVPIVTASDGGGSIRIPASFTGLIGLKPSRGRISVGPNGYRGWQGASVNFALTKSVRDTFNLLKALQVEQLEAPFSLPMIQTETLSIPKRSLKIAFTLTSPIQTKVSIEAESAVKQAVKYLEDLGHHLVEAKPEVDGVKAMESYYQMNGVETAAMMKRIEQALGREVGKDDMELMSWALYRSGLSITGVDFTEALSYWDYLTVMSEHFFESQQIDLLLMPATNNIAPLQEEFSLTQAVKKNLSNIDDFKPVEQQEMIWEMFEKSLAYTPFTQQQNLTGQPAISLPIYETENKMPLGVQLSARKGQEITLLEIAFELEKANALHSEIVSISPHS